MEKEIISIITPSFNSKRYVEETINSVLSQKYDNLEYIIIDGGSTDGTIDIIKKYEKYLKFWVSEKDSGMYNAINKGFSKSSGEIMGWINSDDILHKGCLSIINQIFSEQKNINWITGTPNAIDEEGRIVKVLPPSTWGKNKFYYDKIRSIQQESTFWRRSLWDETGAGVDEKFTLAADHELWAKFFQFDNIYNVNALLGSFRKHPEQLSQVQRTKYMNQVKMIRGQYNKKENNINYYNYKIKKTISSILPSKIANNNLFKKLLYNTKIIYFDFLKNKFEIQ